MIMSARLSASDLGYLPSDGEYLKAYADRLKDVLMQMRGRFADHETWWEHRSPKPCRMCSIADMCDYLASLLQDIPDEDKKAVWRIVRPATSYDALSFKLKRIRK